MTCEDVDATGSTDVTGFVERLAREACGCRSCRENYGGDPPSPDCRRAQATAAIRAALDEAAGVVRDLAARPSAAPGSPLTKAGALCEAAAAILALKTAPAVPPAPASDSLARNL